MRHPSAACVFLFCLFLSGCSREDSYRSVVRGQIAAWEETTEILKTVKDEASMARAREKLQERQSQAASIAERAKGLGTPSTEMREKLRDEYGKMEVALARLQTEVRRVRALPGGAAFLETLDFREAPR